MVDAGIADFIIVVHFAFIIFVVAGGFAVLRWGWVAFVHLPAAAWGVLIELLNWPCPLTAIETSFRQAAGRSGYSGGFIDHYLMPLIYPSGLTRSTQFVLAAMVLVANMFVYTLVVYNRKRKS